MRKARSTPTYSSPSVALVKQALAERRMTQQELAQRTDLSKDHLSRIMLGKVPFPKSRDTLTALARALELDPLVFTEYRQALAVLPESTRRLCAHLKEQGITQQEFIRRVPGYSEGHMQLILRGGSPFPKDPQTIEVFAAAAEASPFLFPEYMPLADWRERLTRAAAMALDSADAGVFVHLLGKIDRHFEALDLQAQAFDERLIGHFLARAFGGASVGVHHDLDDALTYMPPLEQYQLEVRQLLEHMHAHRLGAAELARRAGQPLEAVMAVLKGQMQLKDGPLRRALLAAVAPKR